MAEALVKRGHEVVWWVSDFEHRSKKRRTCGTIDYGDGFSAEVLPSSVYNKHISIARVRYERAYARSLHKEACSRKDRPDIIVHGEPAVCFSDISLKTVSHFNCPLIIDVIDLWPELFEMVFPKTIRWLARPALQPLYAKRRRFFHKAQGFLAVSKNYLQLAQNISPGTPGTVSYLGTQVDAYRTSSDPLISLPKKKSDELWCIYVGTLGRNYDIPAILTACERLVGQKIKMFVAGDGDLRPEIEAAAARGKLHYLGRLSFEALTSIYRQFDIALACYANGSTVSMPFKAFDYLAAGLPVVTSLSGDLGQFVDEKGIGASYRAGDSFSLCEAILSLVLDPHRREKAKEASRELGAEMDYSKQYSIAAKFIEKISRKGFSLEHHE